jgi:hypothetical protein
VERAAASAFLNPLPVRSVKEGGGMFLGGVRNWFGGSAEDAAAALPLDAVPEPDYPLSLPTPVEAPSAWPASRIAVVESLWGRGFLFPGGEEETLRLAKPLGLSAEASLLLLGAGPGGPARVIAAKLGVLVNAFEADPDLAALAMERSTRAGLGRRAQTEMWYPASPAFGASQYHHALVLEPLRGVAPEPVLSAVAEALKPAGQLVLLDMVVGREADPGDPVLAAWARLERRPAELPAESTVTRTLGRLGFDVRAAEDVSARHASHVLRGWQRAVSRMTEERPPRDEAALLVAEAELWLLRLRLMRTGRLRLMRWHGVGQPA